MIDARNGNNKIGLEAMIARISAVAKTQELTLLEVGSYKGDSARIFARHFALVTCVDPWAQDSMNIRGIIAAEAEREFDKQTKGLANIVKVKDHSLNASKRYPDGSVDVVYIDALHDYTSVRADIAAWRRVPRLFLCGHDYNAKHFKGVIRAVDEAFGKPDATFVDHSWLVRIR